ncbi:hypothetical protein VP01_2495g2, partial [Puccinia sorghi]
MSVASNQHTDTHGGCTGKFGSEVSLLVKGPQRLPTPQRHPTPPQTLLFPPQAAANSLPACRHSCSQQSISHPPANTVSHCLLLLAPPLLSAMTAPIPAIICNIYCKSKCQKERRLNANLNLSGVAHLPVHISNPNPNAMIQLFNKSFICWADQSRKKKLLLSSSVLFQLWVLLSNHNTNVSANISLLNQTIRIPTSQMALNMLGR